MELATTMLINVCDVIYPNTGARDIDICASWDKSRVDMHPPQRHEQQLVANKSFWGVWWSGASSGSDLVARVEPNRYLRNYANNKLKNENDMSVSKETKLC